MNYKPTIGLEIHAELKTKSKMFCGCKNDPFNSEPNANICPICAGHPGTLPTLNEEAIKHVLKVGISIKGKLADFSEFDRKNYFYPDIPKGYQISQYKYPLVSGGEINGVEVTRVHLEEDTGTSLHEEGDFSLVDFNRAGVPLMELVTEPVIHSAKEASDFAKELQLILRYLGASDANMERGEMRVEANISIARAKEIADERGINADRGLLYEELSYKIRGVIFNVRNALGSGHKESVYQNALEIELKKSGIKYEKEKGIDVFYNSEKVGNYRPDFIVEDKIILELKALPFIGKKEREQLWHYLKGSEYRLAFIANFSSSELQIERVVFDSIRDNPHLDPRLSTAVLGTKVEVKNLNSFKAVEKAIEYELKRQEEVLEGGEEVVQETRGWDENKQKTFSQRKKEESHDYRYFPEPDLPKLKLSEIDWAKLENLKKELGELPKQKRERYLKDFGLKIGDVEFYVNDFNLSKIFEDGANNLNTKEEFSLLSNYIISDLAGLLKNGAKLEKISGKKMSEIVKLIGEGKLSSRGAKDVLNKLVFEGGEPRFVAEELGVIQVVDEGAIREIVKKVLGLNSKVVEDYKAGKGPALQYLIGQVMKESKGSAKPDLVKKIILSILV